MPRIQFRWHNIRSDLREIIAAVDGLPGDDPELLESAFGRRPDHAFIKKFWAELFTYWLELEPSDAQSIAASLRTRKYGNMYFSDALPYIQSCVTAHDFYDIVLQAFLIKGQQPPHGVQLPVAPSRSDSDADGLHTQRVSDYVANVLHQQYDASLLTMTTESEFRIVAGSCVVHVTINAPYPIVRIHAVLVRDVQPSTALFESLNLINSELPVGRIFFEHGQVFIETSLIDATFNDVSLMNSVKNIAHIADFYDDRIQHAFGGNLMRILPSKDQIDV